MVQHVAPQLATQPQPSIFGQAAGNLGDAANIYGRIGQGGAPAQSMNAYLSPYQSQVID